MIARHGPQDTVIEVQSMQAGSVWFAVGSRTIVDSGHHSFAGGSNFTAQQRFALYRCTVRTDVSALAVYNAIVRAVHCVCGGRFRSKVAVSQRALASAGYTSINEIIFPPNSCPNAS